MNRTQRLFLLISIVIFSAFLIFISLSLSEKARDLRTFQIERELPALGMAAYSRFNYISASYKAAGEKLLKDDYIRDWILGGEEQPEELIAFMKSVKDENSLLDASLVSNLTEIYYGTDGRILELSPENEDRDGWYYHYRESADHTNIDSWFYPETGIIGLYVNIPVTDEDDTFIGVTGGGIEASVFDEVLKYFEHNWNVDLYIIRNDGHLVYATERALLESDTDTVDKIWNSPVLDRITREKMNESGIVFAPEGDKGPLLWGGYMPEWETYLIIERNSKDINDEISHIVRRSFIFEGGIAAIMFFLSLFVLAYTSRMTEKSINSGLSCVHKLQSIVYLQSDMLKTSSRLLSELGEESELKYSSSLATEAVEHAFRYEQIAEVLKLPAAAESSNNQQQKIILNDMVNEILLRQVSTAHRTGVSLIGQLPVTQLIIRSNEALLRFCLEHLLEDVIRIAAPDSDVFFIAGSRGDDIWLDIAFEKHDGKQDCFNSSILDPVFEILNMRFREKDSSRSNHVFKLYFQPLGE